MQTNYLNPEINLSIYDFVIVTSKRSIEALIHFEYQLQDIKAFCVGQKTAEYAQKSGMIVEHTSQGYAKNLIEEIAKKIEGRRGLYLRPQTVANNFIMDFVDAGKMDAAVCYETLCSEDKVFTLNRPSVLLFAAPSQVECFLKHDQFTQEDSVVVIGQTTAEALPKEVTYHLPDEMTLQSMVTLALELA